MDTLPKIKTQSNAKNKIMRAARMLPFLFSRLAARWAFFKASPRKDYKKKGREDPFGAKLYKKRSHKNK